MSLAELISRFNVDDPAFIADPYPVLNELREATPIFWNEQTAQWTLTRFSDVFETLRDRRLGRSYSHLYSHAAVGRAEPDSRWAAFQQHERWSLLCLEPPDHTRIRRLVAKVFTPKAVAAMRPAVQGFGDELLDVCREKGTFELLTDYAQPYSVAVICSMLGVPRTDTQLLLDWSHAIVKMYELSTTDAVREAANTAAAEYIEYTKALIAEKRRSPDGLLVSELAQVEDDGDTLTVDEIISTTMVLLEAGHEATVNTLGNGMRAMLRHPGEWQRVVSGAVPARSAVEEMLRWDPPLHLFERWVLEEGVEIAGQRMEVGQEVAMLFGAAQRDGRRFPEPDRFDAGRGDTAHIGFGGGIHFCVGAPLARQEIEVSVAGLAARFPNLAVLVEPEYHPNFVIRGLTALHLTA
ncbi:MAG: cytochrome P450 [Actinobacteria bacterium]|nr:cytochrome P450 [Actinomycetota bacterium]MSW78651.1 cytochrome P450 [Actinomycetota bacterium]MSX54012.1 cytochrome P450 [Actinomycetota bacterium]MSZ84142.1 cytochrome P450 [Actinomycetota bacterium]MTB19134.1 cytochrome P450 [Actinomycetota bacterium]